MARLRKFVAYRSMERPYTRFSKYKKLSYVRTRPVCKVVRFDVGEVAGTFTHALHLVSKTDLQIRDNSIESARQSGNRLLEKNLGKTGYRFMTRIYPHHVLRENPLASGAGADRLSTGMAHSFGKPIGVAAQVKKGAPLFTVYVNKENVPLARQALKRAGYKMPCSCSIVTIESKVPSKKAAPKTAPVKATPEKQAVAAQ
jgi:large subunit ribosomal protein L10e